MSSLLHKCMTKATIAAGDQMKYGTNWLLSRRAILKVFDDHLECGDWNIDYSGIHDAVLYSIRSTLFIPGYILRIETADKAYHFGMNRGSFWKGDLPFPVRRERGRLRYSALSIIVRLFLVGYLIYLAWMFLSGTR